MKIKLLIFLGSLFLLFMVSPVRADSSQNHAPVCIPGGKDSARCHARVVTNQKGHPQSTTSPTGYSATQFQTAYGLSGATSSGRTLAIVDAFDDPTVEQDLG